MKRPTQILEEDRAVSPVVGVALLIAIAVILAAVVGAVVLGLGTSGAEAPQASLSFNTNLSSENVTINHDGGDPIDDDTVVLRGGFDNEVELSFTGGNLSAGQSTTVNLTSAGLSEGDDVEVIWQNPEGDDEQSIGRTTA